MNHSLATVSAFLAVLVAWLAVERDRKGWSK